MAYALGDILDPDSCSLPLEDQYWNVSNGQGDVKLLGLQPTVHTIGDYEVDADIILSGSAIPQRSFGGVDPMGGA